MAALTIAKANLGIATLAGGENLLTPDPKEVAFFNAGTVFALDFGAAVSFDTFFLGFLKTPVGAGALAYEIYPSTGLGTGPGVLAAGGNFPSVTTPRRHAFAKIANPVSSRYWYISLANPGGDSTLGIMAFGLGVQPLYGREWGSGRTPIDLSTVQQLRGGGFGIERGARKGLWEFTCGDLSDAETATLWDIALDVGESAPVIVCEDPAFAQPELAKATHYGLFRRPEAYQRLIPNANRWAFRVEEWV